MSRLFFSRNRGSPWLGHLRGFQDGLLKEGFLSSEGSASVGPPSSSHRRSTGPLWQLYCQRSPGSTRWKRELVSAFNEPSPVSFVAESETFWFIYPVTEQLSQQVTGTREDGAALSQRDCHENLIPPRAAAGVLARPQGICPWLHGLSAAPFRAPLDKEPRVHVGGGTCPAPSCDPSVLLCLRCPRPHRWT